MKKLNVKRELKHFRALFDSLHTPDTQEEEIRFLKGLVEAVVPALALLVGTQNHEFESISPKSRESLTQEALTGLHVFPILLEYLRARSRGVADFSLAADIAKEKALENLAVGIDRLHEEKPK